MLTVNTIGINRVVISLILFFRFLFLLLILFPSFLSDCLFYSQLRKTYVKTLEVKLFLLLSYSVLAFWFCPKQIFLFLFSMPCIVKIKKYIWCILTWRDYIHHITSKYLRLIKDLFTCDAFIRFYRRRLVFPSYNWKGLADLTSPDLQVTISLWVVVYIFFRFLFRWTLYKLLMIGIVHDCFIVVCYIVHTFSPPSCWISVGSESFLICIRYVFITRNFL